MQTLQLNDYERRDLIAHYETDALPDFITYFTGDKEHDAWYGYQIGDRMFDLNVWLDDTTGKVSCAVYECYWMDGNWHTNTKQNGWVISDEER
jgi:hypothetical protein